MTNVHQMEIAENTAHALRLTRADLAECIGWINRYRSYLDTGSMTPAYRKHVEAGLAGRIRSYLAGLRDAHAFETRLDAMGVEFNRSN